MKKLFLLSLLVSCETIDLYKYVIITSEGRWICETETDMNIYSTCTNEVTKEIANSIKSGDNVVLEIKRK